MVPSRLTQKITRHPGGYFEGNPEGKVCVFISTDAWYPQISGVSRTYAELTETLITLGYRVILLTPQNFKIKLALTKEKHVWLWMPTVYWRAKKILKAEQPDYIINAVEGPIGLGVTQACERLKLPFNTALHTRWDKYVAARYPWAKQPGVEVTKLLLKTFHHRATHVSVRSEALKQAAQKELGLKSKRMSVWPGSVNTSVFYPRFSDAGSRKKFWNKVTDLRNQECHLKSDEKVLLYVGRVSAEKNIEAFLTATTPKCKKIIVGQGPELPRLQKKYKAHKDVLFLGGETDSHKLAQYYSAADVLVFPSKTETFGLVAIEALACNTPVACLPELPIGTKLTKAKVAGQSKDLSTAIATAQSLDRCQCSAFVKENFELTQVTKKMIQSLAPSQTPPKKS